MSEDICNKFGYSTDEENFTGFYDTREAAASEGFSANEDLDVIWTGQCVVPERIVDADSLIDQIAVRTTDEAGDWADGYLNNVPEEAIKDLQEELQDLWDRWEEKHGLKPQWFNVVRVQNHWRDAAGMEGGAQ